VSDGERVAEHVVDLALESTEKVVP